MLSEKSVMGAPYFIKFSKTVKFTRFSIFCQIRQDMGNSCVSLERELKIKWIEKKNLKIGQLEPKLLKTERRRARASLHIFCFFPVFCNSASSWPIFKIFCFNLLNFQFSF